MIGSHIFRNSFTFYIVVIYSFNFFNKQMFVVLINFIIANFWICIFFGKTMVPDLNRFTNDPTLDVKS